MDKNHTQFDGSIPKQYDTYLGPLLFEFSAKDLAERISAQIPPNSKILEIACGTGISTEYLRKALPKTTTIVATDLNQDMLNFAKEKRGALSGVTYQVADALDLPFKDEEFDAVVCQFGVMFFPDKAKGLSEMVRVAKPGGFLIFNVWDSTEHNQVVQVVQNVVTSFFNTNPPTFLRMPFGFYDVPHIKGLMEEVGLQKINSHIVSTTIEHLSAHHIAKGFVTGNPTITEINERANVDSNVIIEAAATAIKKIFGSPNPKISLQEIVFTATKPD